MLATIACEEAIISRWEVRLLLLATVAKEAEFSKQCKGYKVEAVLEVDTSTAVAVSKQLCASRTSVFVDLHSPTMDSTCSDPTCAQTPSVVSQAHSELELVSALPIPAQVAKYQAKPHSSHDKD